MAVYGLKRATPKMKYQHMRMVLDFRADLKDKAENPPDRHVALEEIKGLMSVGFHEWFNDVYKLRSEGKQEEYEAAIFGKLKELSHEERIPPNREIV